MAENAEVTRITQSSGDHFHAVDIPAFNSSTNGAHNHTVTVNSGGLGTSFNLYQPYMVSNFFVFLGK